MTGLMTKMCIRDSAGVEQSALPLEEEVVGHREGHCQPQGGVAGDLVELASPLFPLLGQPLQRRDRYGEQVDDDGGVDVGGDGEGKDCLLYTSIVPQLLPAAKGGMPLRRQKSDKKVAAGRSSFFPVASIYPLFLYISIHLIPVSYTHLT